MKLLPYYVPDYRLEPDEDRPVLHCDNCSAGIYINEEYYNIDAFTLCERCVEDMKTIAN